jgi:acyl-CoA thioesterase FadM
MYPVLRLAGVAARGIAGPPLPPLGESVLRMRVWPGDLDYNFHLNNGRYLTLMDLGRIDLMIRVGAVPAIRRNRWAPVVASLAIRYRRPLGPFEQFELRTRAIGWDDQWFFLEQRFTRGSEVAALAVVKTLFLGGGRRVAPAELIAATGQAAESPPIPDSVRRWEEAEQEIQSVERLEV